MADWVFLTKQGLALLYIAQHPQSTLHEIALALDTTPRTVHRVLEDLERAGYITWQRTGRGNIYQISALRRMKHGLIKDSSVGELLKLLVSKRREKN